MKGRVAIFAKRSVLALAALLIASSGCFGRSSTGEVHLDPRVPPPGPDFSLALYESVGVRLQPGHAITWLPNGTVFDALEREVRHAKVSVNVVTFIWSDGAASDRLLAAISERTKAGAHCRLLIDAVGTMNPGDTLKKKLRAAGCEVKWMRPVPGQDDIARDHRKIAVIDGRVAFTGGFGIDDKWLGDGLHDKQWRDTAVRVEGPAVAQMQQAFAENWQEAGGELLPEEDFPPLKPAGHARAAFVTSTENSVITKADRLMQLLIGAARERVWLENAYFVPSEPILGLLKRRARDGVEVRVLTAGSPTDSKPYLPPQRARMGDLVDSGAKAWEYEPTMMHAKTVLIDDSLVAVGSANLDALSLNKLDEGMLVIDDPETAAGLVAQWQTDLAHCTPVKAEH